MISQLIFNASGPFEVSGNLLSTNTGNLGSASQPYANIYATGSGNVKNLYTDSGVFNYLNPTGRFFPPLVSFAQRMSLFTGFASPAVTSYDGLTCFQLGASGEKLMVVQSGQWKTVTLT